MAFSFGTIGKKIGQRYKKKIADRASGLTGKSSGGSSAQDALNDAGDISKIDVSKTTSKRGSKNNGSKY